MMTSSNTCVTERIRLPRAACRVAVLSFAAVLLGMPAVTSAQPANLVSFDNQAAWDMAVSNLSGDFIHLVWDFNDLPTGPLDQGPNFFESGFVGIDVATAFPLFVNNSVDGNFIPQYVDGSNALGGALVDPGNDVVTVEFLISPVNAFYFTIQHPQAGPLPALGVVIEGSTVEPTSTASMIDGFYGVVDTNGGTFNSFSLTLLPVFPLQEFIIDDINYIFEDIIVEPDTDLTFTGASGSDPTDYEDADNWEGTLSGTPALFPPSADTNVSFNLLAGAGAITSITLPVSGAAARTMDVRDQTFTFSASGIPTAPLAIGNLASAGEGVSIGSGGELLCAADCHIQVSNPANNTSTVIAATGALTVNGGTYETDRLDNSAGMVRAVNGGTLNVANEITLANGGTLDVVGSGLETPGSANIGAPGVAPAGTVRIGTGGSLRGKGTVVGNVVSAGRVAPGFSPEIITIDGDYTQEATGVLEIEVGGLAPGIQHDQLQVSGTATLNGVLEVPIIDGFLPGVGDEVTFLIASGVVNTFSGFTSPNLAAVDPNLALRILYNPTDVRLQFTVPSIDIQFGTAAAAADWASDSTWTTGTVPDTTHIITLGNLSGEAQRVDVQSENAFTHQLAVMGNENTITVGVINGQSLSATVGVTVGNNGIVELDTGSLVSSFVSIQSGGRLSGDGTVVADLLVGVTAGPQQATLSPGFSVGHLDVSGDYRQGSGGTLLMDIEGSGVGQFDTINVSGEVELGGTLRIDASNLTDIVPGTVFGIIEAGSLVVGTIFENVETIGNDDIFFAPIYAATAGVDAGFLAGGGSGGGCGVDVCAGVFLEGDMNRNGMYDDEDVQAFALALTRPLAYFTEFFIFGNESGDVDDNGFLDFDDIDGFATLLSGTGASTAAVLAAIEAQLRTIPEPASFILFLCGGYFLIMGRVGSRMRLRSQR